MLRRTFLFATAAAATPAWAQTTNTPPPAEPQLETYEPVNALERTFIAAYDSPQMRPAFRYQFMESHVLLVTQSSAANAAPRLRTLRGDDRAALIFTSAPLMARRFGAQTPHVSLTGRAALERVRQHHVVINFGYAPMLMLDPEGIENFLDISPTPDSAGPSQ